MTLTEKKRRAAVIAVTAYTQMDTNPNKVFNDAWEKRGVNRIMRGNEILQRRLKTPGVNPFL